MPGDLVRGLGIVWWGERMGGERGVGTPPPGGDGLRGAIWPGMGEGKAEDGIRDCYRWTWI